WHKQLIYFIKDRHHSSVLSFALLSSLPNIYSAKNKKTAIMISVNTLICTESIMAFNACNIIQLALTSIANCSTNTWGRSCIFSRIMIVKGLTNKSTTKPIMKKKTTNKAKDHIESYATPNI